MTEFKCMQLTFIINYLDMTVNLSKALKEKYKLWLIQLEHSKTC